MRGQDGLDVEIDEAKVLETVWAGDECGYSWWWWWWGNEADGCGERVARMLWMRTRLEKRWQGRKRSLGRYLGRRSTNLDKSERMSSYWDVL